VPCRTATALASFEAANSAEIELFLSPLTEEVGHPALQAHLSGIMALQRAAPDNGWGAFHRMVERAYPKFNETPPFNLGDE
jgi:hypothetical protein